MTQEQIFLDVATWQQIDDTFQMNDLGREKEKKKGLMVFVGVKVVVLIYFFLPVLLYFLVLDFLHHLRLVYFSRV